MNIGNTVLAGDIVLLALVALFVVAGLGVSLIAITLTSIKESNGRTPQWPVSWPEPPLTISRQRLDVASGRASLPSQQVTLPLSLRDAGEPARQINLPQRVEIPRQRLAPPQPVDVPTQRVSPRS
ncbi:hypothetical protein [Streptosporangium sp. V21-05]|uniref:hypothetical protein n=1 Tax=Streptosporangium sp. V21-05 TaxID=3446115 RepID=UPI003F529EC3